MKILLTNDDGIRAKGLSLLYGAIKEIAEVVVVAPETEQSAVGHAITLSDPLRVTEIKDNQKTFGYAVNGTPADCVKIAVKAIMEMPPQLVISGINIGPNMGTDVIYSGTVSAATEGTILGIPSFAISLDTFKDPDFSYAASFAKRLALIVMEKGLPRGTSLNVNVPAVPEDKIRGVVITRQGKSRFVEGFDKRVDPRNRVYYWQTGKVIIEDVDEGADRVAVNNNMVSITPIHYDLTDHKSLEELKRWRIF
ncbi:MAG: 5'/3'-nucleotidase SurE [Nitrospinae bacterium]|nr:5'/3'-nucleotidase SurE [Nitrospinota bacterium]